MISIIVPIYRVERYLRQCLDSIINQTYRDIEVLLIDDGSPDKCGEICEEYAKKDSRIRVFHTKNNGLSAARNLGLREAKGEYIGFVDSDDWIEHNMYECLLRQIEMTGADISNCGAWSDYQDNQQNYIISDGFFYGKDAVHALIHDRINTAVWNKLYKSEIWKDIIFPIKHNHEDVSTIYKLYLKARSVSSTSGRLYHHRMRNGSIVHTNTMNNLMDCYSAVYDRYSYLSELSEFKNDQKIIECMEKQIASATIRIWAYIYDVPKKQRDYFFLNEVSCFARNHFPIFGKKEWNLSFRAFFFFVRHANDTSFMICCMLNRLYLTYRMVFKEGKKTLFPST